MKINYLEIFKKALKTTWKRRYLWWFGFFIMLANAGGMGTSWDNQKMQGPEKEKVMEFLSQNFHWILTLLVILAILGLVVFILSIISRGTIIVSVGQNKIVGFKSGIKLGARYFWKIFFISLALCFFVFVITVVLGIPVAFLFFSHSYLLGIIMALIALIIFIPLIVLAAYLKIFGYLYAVLGKLKFWDSLDKAYNLFRKNLGASLIMGLLFILINLILFFATLSLLLPLGIIFLGLGLLPMFFFGPAGMIAVGVLGALIFVLILLLVRSVYEVFAQAAWIYFFQEIAQQKTLEEVLNPETEKAPEVKAMPVVETRKN